MEKKNMSLDEAMKMLKALASKEYLEKQKHFGVITTSALGLRQPQMRAVAREIGKNHALALQLWKTGVHEAMHVATMIADKKLVTPQLMDEWQKDFNSWDIVDGCISNLFCRTPYAYDKAFEWSKHKTEYQKRAGFSMMAYLAVHDKKATDKKMLQFLPVMIRDSTDERNFVRKAVNWALRSVGKRNKNLCDAALIVADELRNSKNKTAKWIGSDAYRELNEKLEEGYFD
mgnify:CR=1 FL=1